MFPGEPNIGPPDGYYSELPCGGELIIDIVAEGYSPIDITVGDADPDVVYYERENPSQPSFIDLDRVSLQVGTGPSGSCGSSAWHTVFNWGDGNTANNGHLGGAYPEMDNQSVPFGALYNNTGITVDIDALAPVGIYPCIRIVSPINWPDNDGAEVDAIEILPPTTTGEEEPDFLIPSLPEHPLPERHAPDAPRHAPSPENTQSSSSPVSAWWLASICLLPLIHRIKRQD